MEMVSPTLFTTVLAALLDGRVDELADHLRRHPALAQARSTAVDAPYNGYFCAATLLHHVAENPQIVPHSLPGIALAKVLIQHGVEVDAVTATGPDQPDDIGWTTLGLAATSGRPSSQELMTMLVQAGADLDARNGGALIGALYYGQGEAARWLMEHGARLDFFSAAALGRLDLIEATLVAGIAHLADAPRLVHYSREPLPETVRGEDILALALAGAAQYGQNAVIERLLAAGADINAAAPRDHRATALHWAVFGDQCETIALLLRLGADPQRTDGSFFSTPAGWARHLERSRALVALQA